MLPLELVQIVFSVPSQDNCIIGVTDDSGELETNYPPAYGGVVEFVKDEYLTNFYPIDTYEYTENPGIIGYAVAGYPQEVIELHKIVEVPVSAKKYEFSKCITHENGNDKYCLYNFGDALFEPNLIGPLATVYANGSKSWKHEFYLSDSPQQLGENETVTYTLIRRADLNPNVISEEYSTSFRVEGNQTTTIQLVPGIYEEGMGDGNFPKIRQDVLEILDVKFFLGNNIKLKEISLAKKDYFFGIRPEHFSLSEDCQYKFKPKIDLTENLGNEKIAYMKVDQHEISAKLPGQNNDVNHIGFDVKDIFIFDEDGNRVRS